MLLLALFGTVWQVTHVVGIGILWQVTRVAGIGTVWQIGRVVTGTIWQIVLLLLVLSLAYRLCFERYFYYTYGIIRFINSLLSLVDSRDV